jgi:hypothetical protein
MNRRFVLRLLGIGLFLVLFGQIVFLLGTIILGESSILQSISPGQWITTAVAGYPIVVVYSGLVLRVAGFGGDRRPDQDAEARKKQEKPSR